MRDGAPMVEENPDAERLTRNWNELLQELRVVQTGVQILTGFLLTVPFSQRFESLTSTQVAAYLIVLCGSALTTALVVAPVAFHRVLFRDHRRPWLVAAANRSARSGLATLALTSSGAVGLVFDLSVGRTAAWVSLAVALVLFLGLWLVVPLASHGGHAPPPEEE